MIIATLGWGVLIPYIFVARAANIGELERNIEQKNNEIRKLEEEARQFRAEIAKRQEAGRTLKEELDRIERTIKQLQRDVALTERKIEGKELEINKTAREIQNKEESILKLRGGLAFSVQAFFEKDQESLLEILLREGPLSNFIGQMDRYAALQNQMLDLIGDLRALREELTEKKEEAQAKKAELEDLEDSLRGRRRLQENTRKDRADLLATTKNQEKRYQELLREREERRAALEREIEDIEERIRVTIDPSRIPRKASGVLGWPLADASETSCWQGNGADIKNCVTQYFGYTSFAAVGGYGGRGHNGVDFRAAQGTPVYSAGSGVVEGVGDTDTGCQRASYGKWVLVRHPNNLSTLYAHLANIQVQSGETIRRGQQIGLSGASGYATGPHLHLTLLVSEAVEIQTIRSKVCGRGITLPIAGINAYLNPLDYL